MFALGFKATQSFKACNAHNDLLWSQNKTAGFLTCDIKTEIEKVNSNVYETYAYDLFKPLNMHRFLSR